MIEVIEIIAELRAGNFANRANSTSGRVLKVLGDNRFFVEVDDVVKGVELPASAHSSEELAKHSIIEFWRRCDDALENMPCPKWQKNPGMLE